MEHSGASNQLLKNKYDLHKAPEVDAAARRTQARTGEKVPQDPLAHIGNYLDRFHEITDREDPEERERGIDAVRSLLYSKYVIKPDEVPESYWENQRRIARERGQGGDLAYVDWEELKRESTEVMIADQSASLDKWIDYLSSPDAPYSDAMKYFTLRSVLNMGQYDKERKVYPQRSFGTTKPFPDLNREALAYILDVVEKKYTATNLENDTTIDPEPLKEVQPQEAQEGSVQEEAHILDGDEQRKQDQELFEKLLAGENFPKLYAWAIEKVTPANAEALANTQGQWVTYNQGSDHMSLVASLQGHGTGWCSAGESVAQAQLEGGDFYVYYSNDQDGQQTIPRVAIRMEENKIAEVRGIGSDQNLDPYIGTVVEDKLEQFQDGREYKQKIADMKRLTGIEKTLQAGESLSVMDLSFLYEIDSPIQGFGYSRDPRVEELRAQRNLNEDMPIVFACERSQIAYTAAEIRPDTKAYIGALTRGIFDHLPSTVEYVYTVFPEGKIRRQRVEIGGKTKDQLQHELEQADVQIGSTAHEMLQSSDFTHMPNPENVDTVRLKVQDLGLSGKVNIEKVYERAQKLGLELCPAEIGPHYRLMYADQPDGERLFIGMKMIDDRGRGQVFSLEHIEYVDADYLWLNGEMAYPINLFSPKSEFVFVLPKNPQAPQSPSFFDRIFKR